MQTDWSVDSHIILVLGTASVDVLSNDVDPLLSGDSRPSHLSPIVGSIWIVLAVQQYDTFARYARTNSVFFLCSVCLISDPSKRCQASIADNIWGFQLLLLYVTDKPS